MKKLLSLVGIVAVAAGCASQDAQDAAAPAADQPLRLGAADALGWQLGTSERTAAQASAEERDLAAHE